MLMSVMAGVAGMTPGSMTPGIIAHGVIAHIGVIHRGMVPPGVSDGVGAGVASIAAGIVRGIMVVDTMVVITEVTMVAVIMDIIITIVAGTGLITGIRQVVRLLLIAGAVAEVRHPGLQRQPADEVPLRHYAIHHRVNRQLHVVRAEVHR